MVISDNTLETIMFDYNAPDYAATAFTDSEAIPPETKTKTKASARPTAVLRRKVSPTLVEELPAETGTGQHWRNSRSSKLKTPTRREPRILLYLAKSFA